jgi:hypothetical protein
MQKLVLIFHDKSIFSTNEGHGPQPKTKGAGIMVSDYIEEHDGSLKLSSNEAALAKARNGSKSVQIT